ncbi:hypothetical protein MEZE111188_21535 [Mesobacillus zeae]
MAYNIVDILFQLFSLLFLVGFVIVIVSLLRSQKRKSPSLSGLKLSLIKFWTKKEICKKLGYKMNCSRVSSLLKDFFLVPFLFQYFHCLTETLGMDNFPLSQEPQPVI